MRVVLASASPARLATLRAAGISPVVIVSGVDEGGVDVDDPRALPLALATLKARAVVDRARSLRARLVIGCDSMLDLDGASLGKPSSPEDATARWHQMRGRSGVLRTGHWVIDLASGEEIGETAETTVWFADISDREIDTYVATGEPLEVAGAFTIDGRGGAFVTRVDGDPHNVVGISLPLLRDLVGRLGIGYPSLWTGEKDDSPDIG